MPVAWRKRCVRRFDPSLIAFALLAGGCMQAGAADEQGWAEVRSSRPAPDVGSVSASETAPAPTVGRSGDRLWISDAGDTFASVALSTTGSADHAGTIARYNERSVDEALSNAQSLTEREMRRAGYPK